MTKYRGQNRRHKVMPKTRNRPPSRGFEAVVAKSPGVPLSFTDTDVSLRAHIKSMWPTKSGEIQGINDKKYDAY